MNPTPVSEMSPEQVVDNSAMVMSLMASTPWRDAHFHLCEKPYAMVYGQPSTGWQGAHH
jgi:hypothetical protein